MKSGFELDNSDVNKRVRRKTNQLLDLKEILQDLEKKLDYPREDQVETAIRSYMQKIRIYNDLKDTAMGLIQVISEKRSVRLIDIMREIGLQNTT